MVSFLNVYLSKIYGALILRFTDAV